jgi:hypothetical protein
MLNRLIVALLFALALLPLAGCATAVAERPTAATLRVVCELAQVRAASRIDVVTETAPVLQLGALRQRLDARPLTSLDVQRLSAAEAQIAAAGRDPVILPAGTGCHWNARISREPYDEAVVIELSKVVPDGTAANSTPGIFVRISAGGRPGAEYYWVPLVVRGGKATAGPPIELDVSDG